MKRTILSIFLILSLVLSPAACRKNLNTTNPQVIQAAALLDAENTCKTLEDGLVAANNAVEGLEAAEPGYYAKVKPLIRRLSAANALASSKIKLVSAGGTADWRGAMIAVGSSVSPQDLTVFDFKNPGTQSIVSAGFSLLVATLSQIQVKYSGGAQ